MAGTVATLRDIYSYFSDDLGKEIGQLWDKYDNLRQPWIAEKLELRNFIFQTDTTSTVVDELDWHNKTTVPKICQIRDNLHSNYISSLFPNDAWLQWEGKTLEDDVYAKKNAIQSYIMTKTLQSGFRDVASTLVYDYIDYGNCFGATHYVRNGSYDPISGDEVGGYQGPEGVRISPLDIVFNPTAPDFKSTPKIVRKIMQLGEIVKLAAKESIWKDALDALQDFRKQIGEYRTTDFNKAMGYQVDGFGDLREYFGSEYVEVLTFEGDYLDRPTMELHEDQQIIVIDRTHTVVQRAIPSPLGKARISHAGWRKRTDNLYAMGPLDNLVGMQYRIDHLENLKADAQDLMVHPPLVIEGDVDPFIWEPNTEIHIVGEGSVKELGQNLNGVAMANNEIEILMQRMEIFAGAPKEAMGVRSPGEKTAFEVQALENAAGRIFQEKITNFEINQLEPMLNSMLADAITNLDGGEVVRTLNDELGVSTFMSLTVKDLMAEGLVRPVGARHFAQQAQVIQNINNTLNGAMGAMVAPHISGKALARLIEDSMQLQRYSLIKPFVGIEEQIEAQEVLAQGQEDLQSQAATPLPAEEETPQEAEIAQLAAAPDMVG